MGSLLSSSLLLSSHIYLHVDRKIVLTFCGAGHINFFLMVISVYVPRWIGGIILLNSFLKIPSGIVAGLVLNMKYSHWHPVNSLPGLSHTTTYISSISSPEVSGSLRVSLSGLPTASWGFLLQHTSVKWPKPWAVIHPLAKRKSWSGAFLQKLCVFPFGPSSMSQPWRCCSPRSRHHIILPLSSTTQGSFSFGHLIGQVDITYRTFFNLWYIWGGVPMTSSGSTVCFC